GEVAVGVVDTEAGVRVGYRRDVSNGPTRAPSVSLPGLLRLVRRATAARSAPCGLGPAACGACALQRRAADSRDVTRCRGVLHAVSTVAGADRDRDAGVVEV